MTALRAPWELIAAVIARHRAIQAPQAKIYLGYNFTVHPHVFSPFIAPSGIASLGFAALPVFRGKRVLEIGCGAGIVSCLVALSEAKSVVGVDINPFAVENSRSNVAALGLGGRVNIRQGDLLDAIGPEEKFDIVFANLPSASGEPHDELEMAFFDPGFSLHRRLVTELPGLLARSEGARAYVCVTGFGEFDFPALVEPTSLRIRSVMRTRLKHVPSTLYELTNP